MIVLILWCVLVVGCFVAARSFFSAVLLTGTAVVLLFCIVSVKKSSHTLQTQLMMPEQIKQGKKKSGKLILTDSGAFPLFCVKGTVCCRYKEADADPDMEAVSAEASSEKTITVSEQEEEDADITMQDFSCAVKSYQKEEITVKLSSARAGTVHVWLRDLTVYDMFGLFSYDADISTLAADVVVVPAETGQAGQTETDKVDAEAEQTAQTEADKVDAEAEQTAQTETNEAGAEAEQAAQTEANEVGAEAGQTAKNLKSKKSVAKNAQHKKGAGKKKQRRKS